MKKYEKLMSLATRLHNYWHRVENGKKPTHKAGYWEIALAHFDKRCDDIEKKLDKIQCDVDFYIKNETQKNTVEIANDLVERTLEEAQDD